MKKIPRMNCYTMIFEKLILKMLDKNNALISHNYIDCFTALMNTLLLSQSNDCLQPPVHDFQSGRCHTAHAISIWLHLLHNTCDIALNLSRRLLLPVVRSQDCNSRRHVCEVQASNRLIHCSVFFAQMFALLVLAN